MSDILNDPLPENWQELCRPIDPAEELTKARIELNRAKHENVELRATLRLMIEIAVRILDSSSED